MDIEQLQWKCDCGATAPATEGDYMGHIRSKKHQGHKLALINTETGEVVANSLQGARGAGIVLPKKKVIQPSDEKEPPIEEKPPIDTPPEETPPIEELPPDESPSVSSDDDEPMEVKVVAAGIFSTEVTLPADAFTYYNMAKAIGLEPPDKDFDEWLWDCIKERFHKDYRMQIVIASLPEEE